MPIANKTKGAVMERNARFPVECKVAETLDRKLEKFDGPPFQFPSLEQLIDGARSLIASRESEAFELIDARWLTGGASKLQMAFTLKWAATNNVPARNEKMVLRMEPAASVCETSRMREFQLLQYFEGQIPLPKPYWVDEYAEHFPYPALIYGFSQGVTKPSLTKSNVTGLGTNVGPELRPTLSRQFIRHLALIHNSPIDMEKLSAFEIPDHPETAALWALNWWERVWHEDKAADIPLMALAAGWMRNNLPHNDHACIVHADFRTGNFLLDENSGDITAWLDWELGHIGDRHEDLAWSMSTAFGHWSENGEEFLVCGLMTEEEFISAYEAATGLSVDKKRLHFYKILSAYKAIVIVLAAGYHIANNGKSHQDVLLVWLTGLSAPLMGELLRLLEEVM